MVVILRENNIAYYEERMNHDFILSSFLNFYIWRGEVEKMEILFVLFAATLLGWLYYCETHEDEIEREKDHKRLLKEERAMWKPKGRNDRYITAPMNIYTKKK